MGKGLCRRVVFAGAQGEGIALRAIKFCIPSVGGSATFGSENRKTSLHRSGNSIGRSFCVQAKDKLRPTWRPSAGSPQQKCTPILAYGGTFPGGGSLLSAFLSANLCHSFYSGAKTSPSGGGAVGRRGAFPTPVRAVGLFSPAHQGGCEGFIIRGAPSFSRAPTSAFSPERSDATLLYNPWHRGPEGPMDAIRPSAPKAQAPTGIQECAADAPGPERDPEPEPDPGPDPFSYSLFLTC